MKVRKIRIGSPLRAKKNPKRRGAIFEDMLDGITRSHARKAQSKEFFNFVKGLNKR